MKGIHGKGRRYAPDVRDAAYPARALAAEPTRDFRYWNATGAWLNQKATGTCVGHGIAHAIEDGPVTHPGTIDPFAIYRAAILVDEWGENDFEASRGNEEMQFGTSVRAGAKVLVDDGTIEGYRWCLSMADLDAALSELGPVVIGTLWTAGMEKPDAKGYIYPTGPVIGGHCTVINGGNWTAKRQDYRGKNSWGQAWGQNGAYRIGRSELEYLLFGADGEACVLIEA